LIAAFFAVGLALVLYGWTLTGKMNGLLLMLLGVVFLLTALFVYNKPYSKEKLKKDKTIKGKR
jgi:uncharacterized membrane protein